MTQMRGVGMLTFQKYLREYYGPTAVDRVTAAMNAKDQEALSVRPVNTSWIGYDLYVRFMIQADRTLARGELRLLEESGVFGANTDLSGVYKIFISFTSPQFIIDRAERVWRQYFDRGQLKVVTHDKNHVTLEIRDVPDMPRHHDVYHLGYMSQCLVMSGAKDVKGDHPRCMARGDDHCAFEFRWR